MPAERQQEVVGARVVTEHQEANDAIDLLRDIARTLKQVGDENVRLDRRVEELEDTLGEAESELAAARVDRDEIDALREAVLDFDRGLIDKRELLGKARED